MKVCRYICILLIILIMTIFTISESSRIIRIGYKIARMEEELKKLPEESRKLIYKTDKLKTLNKISLRVKDMKLKLIILDNSNGDDDIALVKTPQKHLKRNQHGKIEA
ncbi:MAG: hypothetical protein ACE5KZ_09320 [Candidatus Scalinduaceae bacterium]